MATKGAISHTMGYDEVAQTWRALCHDGRKLVGQPYDVQLAGWRTRPEFYGARVADMTGWVDNGFIAPGMDVKPGRPVIDRAKIRRNDFDGDLDVELMLQGDDRPYLRRDKRKRQAGVTLRLQFNFLADVPASVLADYGQWVAELIAGLQGQSFDLQIDVFSDVTMEGRKVSTEIRVKRFGKRSSLKSWGALFSPAGYRMLGFTARMMCCREHGVRCHRSMGASIAPGWDLRFDEEARVLTVACHAHARHFPREMMDGKLAALSI